MTTSEKVMLGRVNSAPVSCFRDAASSRFQPNQQYLSILQMNWELIPLRNFVLTSDILSLVFGKFNFEFTFVERL
jgi:hypothetical protein